MDNTPARHHAVVRNGEGQYSLWPADRQPPTGWVAAGPTGTRDECLMHIRAVWTDQRPLGLRTGAGR